MKKPTLLLAAALLIATAATSAHAQIKYVAVVETEIDEQSGAAAKLNRAEVRLMTAELRSTAVKNLPRDRFNIMTSETVMSQGSAKLEECAEENCVIALGAKIGADYIVRGIVSKLGTNLTMSVEMYETEDGNLVATSGVVRSENIADLVDKAAAACAEMYKTFVNTQRPVRKTPVTPTARTVTVNVNPPNGGHVTRNPDKTEYDDGERLSLTASPYDGYAFIGWSGMSNSKNATLTGPVNSDMTLTANFQRIAQTQRTYTVTANVSPPGGGSVVLNPNKKFYSAGEKVSIMALPERGYPFKEWSGDASGTASRLTVYMDKDITLTANFYEKSAAAETRTGGEYTQKKDDEPAQERKPMTGFSLGYGFNGKGQEYYHNSHAVFQIGVAHFRPLSEKIASLNIEGNIWMGEARYYDETDRNNYIEDSYSLFGINAPITALTQFGFLSLEAGVDADLLFADGEAMFNAGIVLGAGVGFSEKRSRRYYYRYCVGYKYSTHVVGMRWMF